MLTKIKDLIRSVLSKPKVVVTVALSSQSIIILTKYTGNIVIKMVASTNPYLPFIKLGIDMGVSTVVFFLTNQAVNFSAIKLKEVIGRNNPFDETDNTLDKLEKGEYTLISTINVNEPDKQDLSEIKAALEYYTDELRKFPKEADELIRKVAIPRILKDEDIKNFIDFAFMGRIVYAQEIEVLLDELVDINSWANKTKQELKLKSAVPYTPKDIANMVRDMALSSINDKVKLKKFSSEADVDKATKLNLRERVNENCQMLKKYPGVACNILPIIKQEGINDKVDSYLQKEIEKGNVKQNDLQAILKDLINIKNLANQAQSTDLVYMIVRETIEKARSQTR
jgi:hypothetical protein